MVQAYCEENDSSFNGAYIEDSLMVYVIGDNKFASYLDFDGDNGYMVVSDDYELYEFNTTGDLKYLKDIDFAYYSPSVGFKYLDEQTYDLVCYEDKNESGKMIKSAKVYAGQKEEGDGYIYDINAYVKDRYPNYTYDSGYSVEGHQYVYQGDTSIYLKNGYTEGNCTLNAAYSLLNDWRRSFYNLPSSKDTIIYKPDTMEPNHNAILSNGWIVNNGTVSSKWADGYLTEKRINKVPKLYYEIRQLVYERNYDYDVGDGFIVGLNHQNIKYLLTFALNKYSYTPYIRNAGNDFTTMEFFFNFNHKAQFLSVSNSSSYKNHSMVCLGFKKYTYKSGWWIFSSTKSAYFLNVDDGHSISEYNSGKTIWYDPNGSGSSGETLYFHDNSKE